MKVGTMDTKPLRVEYLNGDYSKAYDLIAKAGIKMVYKTVADVEPHHAAIHFDNVTDRDKAAKLLEEASIKWYPPTPFF